MTVGAKLYSCAYILKIGRLTRALFYSYRMYIRSNSLFRVAKQLVHSSFHARVGPHTTIAMCMHVPSNTHQLLQVGQHKEKRGLRTPGEFFPI